MPFALSRHILTRLLCALMMTFDVQSSMTHLVSHACAKMEFEQHCNTSFARAAEQLKQSFFSDHVRFGAQLCQRESFVIRS